VDGDELDELLKVPDARGGYHRIPRPLVIQAARRGLYGLRFVLAAALEQAGLSLEEYLAA
jgi:hypothetical protein